MQNGLLFENQLTNEFVPYSLIPFLVISHCSLLIISEVRAAAVSALGLFIGGAETSEQRTNIELNIGKDYFHTRNNNKGLTLPVVTEDASPLVRKELIVALSKIVK